MHDHMNNLNDVIGNFNNKIGRKNIQYIKNSIYMYCIAMFTKKYKNICIV